MGEEVVGARRQLGVPAGVDVLRDGGGDSGGHGADVGEGRIEAAHLETVLGDFVRQSPCCHEHVVVRHAPRPHRYRGQPQRRKDVPVSGLQAEKERYVISG